jgi:hypothetical protein
LEEEGEQGEGLIKANAVRRRRRKVYSKEEEGLFSG